MKTTMTKWLFGLMLMASTAMANDIYIQQSGDNLDLDITQDGQNNVAGNSTTAMSLTGNNMTFSISQVGDGNVIEATINGATYTGNINLTGGLNTVDLDCTSGNCDTVSMSIDVTGDSADVTVNLGSTADASDYTGTIDITSAASETFTLTVNAAAADADIDITNSLGTVGNTSSYTQTGDGDTNGHSLTHNHTGDGAVINMSQSGIYDNKIDVTTSGDNATIDITQTD
jgi:hypothetical protein